MDEDVAAADGRPQVGCLRELRYQLRHELRIAQVRIARQTVDLKQAGQVEQAGVTVNVGRVEVQRGHKELLDFGRRVGLDLQPHRRPTPSLAHLFLDGLEQVLDFVVVDLEVAVARDAKDGGVLDLHAGEQLRQVHADDRLQRREHVPGRRASLGRQRHETRQDTGHLHDGEQLLGLSGPLQNDGQVERLVEQVRERMARVDGQRRQDGEDLAAEDLGQVLAVGFAQIAWAAHRDALALQARQHLIHEAAVGLLGHWRARSGRCARTAP